MAAGLQAFSDESEERPDQPAWLIVELVRHVLLGGISVAGGYLVFPMLRPGVANQMSNLHVVLFIPLFLLFLPYTAGFGGPSLVVALVSICLLFAEIILGILRALVWRIVEYNRGAFAAIVLIVTVALGLVDMYLRFRTG
jgi:hypothetical protein